MKKILSIALVALLAASAFAGISGNANVAFGYNWETGKYGFSNGTGFDFNVDLATADAEKIAEGDVYAGIKASFAVKVANTYAKNDLGCGENIKPVDDGREDAGLGVFADIDEAYVAGEGWKLSITGTQGAPDFAKSAIETTKEAKKDIFGNKKSGDDSVEKAVTYKVSSVKTPGVTLTIADWKASFGFNGNDGSVTAADEFFNYNAFVQTPTFDFDVVTLQLAAIASRDITNETISKRFDSAVGLSAKVGFDADVVTGSVAADYGMKFNKKANDEYDATNGLDIAANLVISPVTLDIYFKNEDLTNLAKKTGDAKLALNLLSAQAKVDLNNFDVPVALTVYGKNMLDKIDGQDFGAKAEASFDAFTVMAKGGYVLGTDKLYLGGEFGYKHDLFTAKVGADWSVETKIDDSNVLSMSASIESSAIVPGATLSLTYGEADKDMNMLDKQTTKQNLGKVEAKCKIAF